MRIPIKQLRNKIQVPQLGLCVYKVPAEEVYDTVATALNAGYRHIDTASFYDNEVGVGQAIKDSSINREDLFVTTKVWNYDQGYDQTLAVFELSLKKLDMDYVDLYLIHWPVPGVFTETWRALETLYKEGRVRAIGVSNFLVHHLEELFESAETIPAVNQIELHPKLMQSETVEFCVEHQILIESWSPLGRANYLTDPTLMKIAKEHHKSTAQIMIRWHLQHEFIVIPKSVRAERQKENIEVFDFMLSKEEMKRIDNLEEGFRVGSHPDSIKR